MKRYADYKNSGVDWIGEIPTHWTVKKLGYVVSSHNGDRGVNYPSGDDMVYEGIPFVSTSELVNGKIILDNVSYITEEKYQQLGGLKIQKDDIIYCLRGSVGKNGITDFNGGTIASSLMGIRSKKVNPHYLSYLLNSPIEEQQRNYLTTGSVSANLSAENVMRFLFALPPTEEQEVIVDYLDSKTSAIDALIVDKQKLIDLLQEKRQAVISEAVTKGLDKTAKMKDSGVEWIGEIPDDWEVKKLKYLGDAIIGLTYSPEDIVDQDEKGTLVLRSSNIQDGKMAYNDNVYVNKEIPEKLMVKRGDILICSRNGSRDLIGKNVLLGVSETGCTFGAFMTIYRSIYNSYLYYVFNSTLFKYLAGSFLTSTVNQLTTGNLNNMVVPLPPLEKREEIVLFLFNKTSEIDSLITDITTQIDKLKEYRQSIISEVVTGKVAI